MAVWVGLGARRGWEALAGLVVRARAAPPQEQSVQMELPSRCQTGTEGTEAPDTVTPSWEWPVGMGARVETAGLLATEVTEAPAGTVLRVLRVLTEHKGVRMVETVWLGERAG
jgi:hypothetical protein